MVNFMILLPIINVLLPNMRPVCKNMPAPVYHLSVTIRAFLLQQLSAEQYPSLRN